MSKFFTLNHTLLILILLGAFILRFYALNSVPPSPSIDEASVGWNAYSVMKTGVDEFGKFPLLYQEGYDDWRRSTYLLLTIPPIAIFGLQAFSVRLPAAILSVLTIWATYGFVQLLFLKQSKLSSLTALLTALLLTICPWHIYISRMGHESNADLSFLVFGVLFFLQGLKNKNRLLLSALFFILSMVSYYPGQIFIPLFIFGIIILFRKELFKIITSSKKALMCLLLLIIILIPILWMIFSPDAISRFRGVGTFTPEAHLQLYTQRVLSYNQSVKNHNIFGMVYYNRHLYPVEVFTEGYLTHFSPEWLFTNASATASFKAPYVGLLYLWELPLILIGIFVVIFSRFFDKKIKWLIFLWFFLAPIPAAIATQTPHANRTYVFVIPLQIFAAVGLAYLFYRFKKLWIVIVAFFAVIATAGIINFCNNYFVVFPKAQSHSFSYALSKTIPYVIVHQNNKKVIFSNEDSLYQSYMVFLFDSHFDPALYQKLGGSKSGGYAATHTFSQYAFRPIVWDKDQLLSNVLFVGNALDFPKEIQGTTFTDLNGKGAIKVIQK